MQNNNLRKQLLALRMILKTQYMTMTSKEIMEIEQHIKDLKKQISTEMFENKIGREENEKYQRRF